MSSNETTSSTGFSGISAPPAWRHAGDRFGLERESLRVDDRGNLTQTPHPAELGSPLTSPHITTDFSESQVEFTTAPHGAPADVLLELEQLQCFTLEHLRTVGESLWPLSMPAALPADESLIPIANYGPSETGRVKHVYRQGLSRRYGSRMQTVSGVHFNFSLGPEFWEAAGSNFDVTEAYFAVLRNFQRRAVYFLYLFGASPAFDRSFLSETSIHGESLHMANIGERGDRVVALDHDARTFVGEHATSLRQSEIGYTNSNQCKLAISYDSLPQYVETLGRAVSTENPAFASWTFERGEQLNSNHLQIENEHYGVIRPKQNLLEGERPIGALERRGVAYLEVRCLDVDPFTPTGIGNLRMNFTHLALLDCLRRPSPPLDRKDCGRQRDEHKRVAWFGRRPELKTFCLMAQDKVLFRDAGRAWLDSMNDLAERLDSEAGDDRYTAALADQRAKFEDVERTPSARLLREMREHKAGHIDYGLELARKHTEDIRAAGRLDHEARERLIAAARVSRERRDEIEAASKTPAPR